MKKYQILNGAYIKIIAMVTMVIDHLGYYFYNYIDKNLYELMRCVGRLSFPIYAYLIVEGMKYTRKPIKYILQLLLLGVIITLGEVIFLKEYNGNVMSTLGFSALTIYFLEKKNYFKLLALIPASIVVLSAFKFFPLNCMYDIYGISIILLFYLADKIAILIASKIYHKQEYMGLSSFTICKENGDYMLLRNAISIILLILFTLIYNATFKNYSFFVSSQIYAIFVGIPLILYNGKRGYNKAWFKWGCYLFYPLQFIFIYLLGLILL